jgi:hypothetical protein
MSDMKELSIKKDLSEIQNNKIEIREIQTKKSFCLDFQPEKFKTGEIQTKKLTSSKLK